MATRKSNWLGLLAIVSSLVVGTTASAQTSVDFPTYKGGNARAGVNGSPNTSGPGRTFLRWWTPSGVSSQSTTSLVIDNTFSPGFTTLGNFQNSATGWNLSPLDVLPLNMANQDASNPFLVSDPANPQNTLPPAYLYAFTTRAKLGSAPTVAEDSSKLRTSTWTFVPPTTTPALYGLYVWIPVGPQVKSLTETFPQRYFVYQVSAAGRTFTDVVDTYQSGGGWVRLGNGGLSTNMVFPYDGVNPLTITLFNTVPYDANGTLTMKGDPSSYTVYADAAMAVPQNGYYDSSPVTAQLTAGASGTNQVIAALNQFSSGGVNGTLNTITTGVVTAYSGPLGTPIWNYSPVQSGAYPNTMDSAAASATGGWTQDTTATRYSGTYVLETPVASLDPVAPTQSVTYSPTLNTGTYQIYAYLPGNNNGEKYGTAVEYVISEGTTQTTVVVDQSLASGWYQIGTRRFTNVAATPTQSAAPLTVSVTNATTNNLDISNNRMVYANAIRFVGERNQSISSTPVIANIHLAGTTAGTRTQVAIVADENGVIHCLDSKGNGDGTTTEYWSYPSTLGDGGTDPNAVSTKDLDAEMPSGFELSSALVQQIGDSTSDVFYLYIASRNGRVYCIDTAGNNDFGSTGLSGPQKSIVGTTNRVWTFPSTAPSSLQVPTSHLGSFRGSIAYGAPDGVPTIYVPTTQGRMYALDASGNSDKSTNVIWAFPKQNQQTLGEIWTTPAFFQDANNSNKCYLYFGTRQSSADDSPGVFYCLDATNYSKANASTTALWSFAGDTNTTPLDFLSGPGVVPKSVILNNATLAGAYVYAVNQNNYVYCFDAVTGAVKFETNELNTGARGAITYTVQSVYDNSGSINAYPVVLVPTADGRFTSLFADPAMANQFGIGSPFSGSRRAFEYITASTSVYSTLAVSNNWMYGNDESGFLYAFNDDSGNPLSSGNPPGQPTITENNPAGAIFRHAKMTLLTQAGYNLARQPTGSNLSYDDITKGTYNFSRTPMAFEWGETAYILVYNYPFITSNGTNSVAPPTVNITISSQGKTLRTIAAESRLLTEPPLAPDDPADPNYPAGTQRDNGYAILSFTFQGGMNQSLPPGPGNISISISTAALNKNNVQQNVALNPALSNFAFQMANPLGISMAGPNSSGNFTDIVSLGLSTSPSNSENLVNGSPKLNGTTKLENLLQAATGMGQHGSSTSVPVWLIDRSMMALQRPDNTGLDGVRMDVKNLAWQGGHLAIYKPLALPYYANFEDYPDNYPNDSFDYPDILSEQIQVVKDPNGTVENPRFNSVSLIPPLVRDPVSGNLRQMQLGDTPDIRKFVGTPVAISVNIPRFQPANTFNQVKNAGALITNSAGAFLNQGYLGRVRAFIDSNTNGLLDGAPVEPYRSFNLSTSVDVDEKIGVTTPSVDLGVLAAGTGYDPLRPGSNYDANSATTLGADVFQPWFGNYKSIFQPFNVQNLGNVNLLNLRVAKASQINGYNPWGFYSASNDLLGFLDGSVDLWSSIDATFAPEGSGPNRTVALPKARITDVAPTSLVVNTVRRANPNLGNIGTVTIGGQVYPDVLNKALLPSGSLKYPPGPPTIGVSVPLGMPVGQYGNTVQVIEKNSFNEIWQVFNNAPETASSPAFNLSFKVRETQLTGSNTAFTAPMVDNGLALPSAAAPFAYSNKQPSMIRDTYGSLIVAWASDRPDWVPAQPTSSTQLGNFKLWFGSVGNSATFGSGGISNTLDSSSALSDLNSFVPVNSGQWFKQAVGNYPTGTPDSLFGSQSGESVIAGTASYGNPTFPKAGQKDPFNAGNTFNSMLMLFTGDAQKQTPSGRIQESKLFIASVALGSGGTVNVSAPGVLNSDPQVQKGRPSIVQTSTGAMAFFTGSSGSQSNIYYSSYGQTSGGAGFGPTIALPFGPAFQWVASPSASGRLYTGVGEPILRTGDATVELAFVGQLQGRSNPEAFYGRMRAQIDGEVNSPTSNQLVIVDSKFPNGSAATNASSNGNVFLDLAPVIDERLSATGQQGLFRALGVAWDRTASIQLVQYINGVRTNLLVDGTGTYDQNSDIITFDTRLGGKVYFDTALGTVRFANAAPNQNLNPILVSYTPRFLRVSTGVGEGYARVTGLYDAREITDANYWRLANNNPANSASDIKTNRFVFTYNRSAGGTSLPARPFVSTLRFGIQLPTRIATDAQGAPIAVNVTGARGSYEIDPANGRIYFTDLDEDNQVTVNYRGMLENGVVFNAPSVTSTVSFIREVAEQPIAIDSAVNESDLSAFLDPFSFIGQRRPPLMWLFWTSARSGVPNVYFETIAPNWNPISVTK